MNDIGIGKLIEISSESIGPKLDSEKCPSDWNGLMKDLYRLLCAKNGFFSFKSALLVRAYGIASDPLSIEKWNDKELWLNTYDLDVPDVYFFAEDVFGGQFGICNDKVVTFDPETAEIEIVGDSIETWGEVLLSDYDYLTGYSLAHEWQKMNGKIPDGYKLVPKQLFVLGGNYDCENLMLVQDVKSMRSRGFFATQLAKIQDGEQISFELID